MTQFSRAAVMRIVELHRTGAGVVEDGLAKFEWTGPSHTAMQGTLDIELAAKTVRKEMPGSNEVVEQGLSATWQPFEISGEWDDKWAGAGFALQMYNDISQFVERFPLVRFTLDVHSIVGMITNFKIKYQKWSKIGWTFTISPHKNESFTEDVSYRQPKQRKPLDQWLNDFKTMLAVISIFRLNARALPLGTDVLSKFDSVLANVNSAIDQLGKLSAVPDTDIERGFLRVSSTFRRIRGASVSTIQTLQQRSSTLDVAYNDVISLLSYDEWAYGTQDALFRALGQARLAEIDMNSRVALRPKAIYRPKPRESLERISVRFYGTPDNANVIYDKNNLSSRVFVGTEELLIPDITS